ncbi:MAG: DNA ligase [Methanonatronarchaeales archaeon]|nr:DNA ligase [Methanonatronarchaeales archaeon]
MSPPSPGDGLKFSRLTEYLGRLEETSSGNDMVQILSELFGEASPGEVDTVVYFVLGEVDAEYRHVVLGMGEKTVMDAIARASGRTREEVQGRFDELGDLGSVAEDLGLEGGETEQGYFAAEEPTVRDVHDGFMDIAEASGSGSQEEKIRILARMMSQEEGAERRYIARIATGTLRLGVGAMTILDGLSVAYVGSKDKRPRLEEAYNLCSDLGLVARTVAEANDEGGGEAALKAVAEIGVEIGRPIKMMLGQRLRRLSDIMEKMSGRAAAEWKYDGERMQCHKDGDEVEIFSRRLDDITSQYPDVAEYVRDRVDADTAIVEGEAMAVDEEGHMEPFQTLMQRKRKYDVEEYVERIPVNLFLFDLLYLDGESWMDRSYPDRRGRLYDVVETGGGVDLTEQIVSESQDEIDEFFERGLNEGTEGVMVKSVKEDSVYRAGAREWLWIKWKRDYMAELADTFDLVVVGALAGKGSRAGTYGALLCAAYNHDEDRFETLCKVGTGFTDEDLEELPGRLGEWETDSVPARVRSEIEPTQWFEPGVVIEVEGAELTRSPVHRVAEEEGKGLALRFPRFLRFREDKSPEQATTSREVRQMYEESRRRGR